LRTFHPHSFIHYSGTIRDLLVTYRKKTTNCDLFFLLCHRPVVVVRPERDRQAESGVVHTHSCWEAMKNREIFHRLPLSLILLLFFAAPTWTFSFATTTNLLLSSPLSSNQQHPRHPSTCASSRRSTTVCRGGAASSASDSEEKESSRMSPDEGGPRTSSSPSPVVRNFRRVGGLLSSASSSSASSVVPLYRCANTDLLADRLHDDKDGEDAIIRQILLEQAGLVIDLRSDSERDETKATAWMSAAAAVGGGFTVQRNQLVLPVGGSSSSSTIIEDAEDRPQPPQRIVLRLDPLHPTQFMRYLEENWLSAGEQVQAALYKVTNGEALHRLRMNVLNRKGLVGLNEAILVTGQRDLRAALQAMTLYWEQYPGVPIVFHCVQGKDRTGLLAMLCQSIVISGSTDDHDDDAVIVADYHASEQHLQRNSGSAAVRDALSGGGAAAATKKEGKLDRHFFSGSPKVVMVETLAWIRSRYGSVSGYLDEIGFDEAWRRRFCNAVVASAASTNSQPMQSRL